MKFVRSGRFRQPRHNVPEAGSCGPTITDAVTTKGAAQGMAFDTVSMVPPMSIT